MREAVCWCMCVCVCVCVGGGGGVSDIEKVTSFTLGAIRKERIPSGSKFFLLW